ncbi:MAG: MATE family efflux transporter [Proteobacteria bacterium ST_bin13]|nr:MAG: MATE family efflux transporter [Proteobacteria bacterium ST_bin13]
MTPADRLPLETRRLLALAWPVVMTSLNWTLLHVTDVAVVGLVSTDQVAILSASRSLSFITIVAGLGFSSGILVFAARADGAGELAASGRVLREGLILALGLGGALGLMLYCFAAPLLLGLGVAARLVPETAGIIRVLGLSYPLLMIIIAVSYFLEGISRPGRVMVVNLAILPFNAVLAWALSGGHFGLPVLGALGAVLATAIAYGIGAAGMLLAVWTLPRAAARGVRDFSVLAWAGVGAGAWRLLRFGTVPAIASGLELVGFAVLIALSTQLGDSVAHGFQIVFSIHNVIFSIALGLGSAAGVRVGNAVGEGQPAAAIPRTLIAVTIASVAIGLIALLLVLAAGPIVALFPATAAVHHVALAMLVIWAPFIIFDGVQVVLVYALRSLGDQVIAGINSIIAYFLVTGGLGLVLVQGGWGPTGLVLASGIGMVAAALLHAIRFYTISRRVRVQK